MSACATCATDVPAAAKFCPECGTAVIRACPSCGATAERGRFCSECGTSLDESSPTAVVPSGPVAERRVTSVLFGDLVGFTPLSESRDAEEVRELLSRYFAECRTVVSRYGGSIEKFIGDAVMAVWGVPVAHEDDAERAVRAGLELVQAIAALDEEVGAPGLRMRVGVVTGEVAVTLGATAEGMVAGDAVNTAARVQSAADPGRVYVDEPTRSLTAAAIAYEDVGDHELKGKSLPVRLYAAVAVVADVGGGQRVDGLEAPLAGRDRELRLLKEMFHAGVESGRPRLVVMDGEAGVGKSRMAWEFEKYVDGLSATVRWHRGRCLSYGEGVSFWAIAEAVRARLGLTESDSGEVVHERLAQGLETFVPDAEERDWLRPRLGALIGAGLGGGYARAELFNAWTTWFERVGADSDGVVLVVDDAQYADDALLDFADHLLATAQSPVFVLALARPELLARRATLGGRRAGVLRLDPLDDTAMAVLVDGLVSDLTATSRDALVARAEGVPLYAVETVRALIDRDVVVPRDGRYVTADGADLDLGTVGAPASLQALVAARLDALAPSERALVADASVLGTVFTRAGLVALGAPTGTIDEDLESLRRKEIVALQQDRFAADRGQYRFVQSVVRQIAYSTQSRRDRKARHLAAADHLQSLLDSDGDLAAIIGRHLLDAVDASSSGEPDVEELAARACSLLERAAARVGSLGSHADAVRMLTQAIERTTSAEDLARMHVAAAEAASSSGEFQLSVDHAVSAVALYDELARPIDAGYAVGLECYSLSLLSDTAAAVQIGEPRLEALDGVEGAELALIELCKGLGRAYSDRGDVDAAVRLADRRLQLAESTGDPRLIAQMLASASVRFQMTGAPMTAKALLRQSADLAREHDMAEVLALSLNNLSSMELSRSPSTAFDTSREAYAVARRTGIAGMIDYTMVNSAIALWVCGRLEEAGRVVAEAREIVRIPSLALALLCLQTRIAEAVGDDLPPIPAPDAGDTAADRANRGDLALFAAMRDGDLVAAARIADDVLPNVLLFTGIDDDFLIFFPPLVRAAVAAGDIEVAERMTAPIENAPSGVLSPVVRAEWRWLRALVAGLRRDDAAAVEVDFRAGIASLDELGAVGMRAQAQEDFARWLAAQGRTDEARAFVERARSTYDAIGARGWRARLDALTPAAVDLV